MVGNVRAAIAKDQGVDVISTEHVRAARVSQRAGKSVVYSIKESESGPALQRRSSLLKSSTSCDGASLPCAEVVPVEPFFVNPNSHEAVRRLLRHIGRECGIKSMGGSDREWVVVACDGLPYNLMRTVMLESRRQQQRQALINVGIPNLASMRKVELKNECMQRGLSQQGSVADLKQRLQVHVAEQLQSRAITLPSPQEGEFDWVVCQSGGLHWEMKLAQSAVDVLWAFVYEAFAKSQGYTTPKQLAWAKSCKDHHRTFDEMSRFTDGVLDELLRPYVLFDSTPTPAGFYEWAKRYTGNLTFTWLLHMVTRYCYGLFMFRRGMRHNNMALLLEARRLLTPIIHARNHPGYQVIELYEESDRLALPDLLRDLLDKCSMLTRSVCPLLIQFSAFIFQ